MTTDTEAKATSSSHSGTSGYRRHRGQAPKKRARSTKWVAQLHWHRLDDGVGTAARHDARQLEAGAAEQRLPLRRRALTPEQHRLQQCVVSCKHISSSCADSQAAFISQLQAMRDCLKAAALHRALLKRLPQRMRALVAKLPYFISMLQSRSHCPCHRTKRSTSSLRQDAGPCVLQEALKMLQKRANMTSQGTTWEAQNCRDDKTGQPSGAPSCGDPGTGAWGRDPPTRSACWSAGPAYHSVYTRACCCSACPCRSIGVTATCASWHNMSLQGGSQPPRWPA